MTFEQMT